MGITVLVADDHEVVRTGIISLFDGTEISVVAEAVTGNEAVRLAVKHKPDVVLLDIQMPGTDGFEALERILVAAPTCRVVMVSGYDNPTYIARAVALGASDFILKGASRKDLISTVTAAAAHDSPCSSGVMHRVAHAMRIARDEDGSSLTNREAQVLRHVALGLSNREISLALSISIETVKEHVQNLLRKIHLTDRTQAAVWAVRKGMV
jgi:DNA-binding NarL/FixJ family response regulator